MKITLNFIEERINLCEKCLEKCYGTNLERLTLLQGNANKYTPIFVRLNLLKAILNYHKGKKKEAKKFLDTASEELQRNTVDEEKMLQGIKIFKNPLKKTNKKKFFFLYKSCKWDLPALNHD
jgi:hypothetical protein